MSHIGEFMNSSRKVPSLDLNDYLSKDEAVKQKFSDDLYNSFKEYGFVILKGHTINKESLQKAYEVQEKFFRLPVETKTKYFLNNGGQRGYTPFGTENAKGFKLADLKEFFHSGRDQFSSHVDSSVYPSNVWPDEVPEMKQTFSSLYVELEKVGDLLLEALEPSLGVKKGFFKEITQDGNTVMRLLHYPPIPEGENKEKLRAAKHADIDLLSLLISASSGGLEILDKDGSWLAIESDAASIVVNAGDQLELITNGEIPSTIHQVVNPNPENNVSRFSSPFFVHPRNEVTLSPLEKFKNNGKTFEPITAGEFLHQRLKEIGLKK